MWGMMAMRTSVTEVTGREIAQISEIGCFEGRVQKDLLIDRIQFVK